MNTKCLPFFMILSLLILSFCTDAHKPGIKKIKTIAFEDQNGIQIETFDKIVFDENRLYVLNSVWNSICVYNIEGDLLDEITLPTGKGPGEFSRYGIRSVDVNYNKICILDAMLNRISFVDLNGIYLNSFVIDFNAFDMEWIKNDDILLLGKSENKIFHVYDEIGNLLRNYGDQIVEVPYLSPTCLYIDSDTIYVSSVKGYGIYRYFNDERQLILKGKRKLAGYELVENAISFPSGINGIAVNDNYFFISTYDVEKQEFYVDIFSKHKNTLLSTINLETWGKVSGFDENGNLMLLRNGYVECYAIE